VSAPAPAGTAASALEVDFPIISADSHITEPPNAYLTTSTPPTATAPPGWSMAARVSATCS
jgi:hypothetical protein